MTHSKALFIEFSLSGDLVNLKRLEATYMLVTPPYAVDCSCIRRRRRRYLIPKLLGGSYDVRHNYL